MTRAVPEWIGKNDDSRIPPRVRLRVFERYGGCCYLSGRRIRPGENWEIEHVVALVNGGKHAEHNLAPVLKEPHKAKTAEDVAEKSKNARVRQRHLGIKTRKSRPMPGSRDSKIKMKIGGGWEWRKR